MPDENSAPLVAPALPDDTQATVAPAVLAPAPEMPASAPVEAASAPVVADAPVAAAPADVPAGPVEAPAAPSPAPAVVAEPTQEAAPVEAPPAPAPVDELTHLRTQLAEQQRLLQQATDAATSVRAYADSLEARLAEAVKDGENKAEQLALHVAAAGAPVLQALETAAPGPVHLAEEELGKIKDVVLNALHIHFGTPA